MNIIDGIARGGALVPLSLAPEDRMLWERSTCKRGMYTNVYCWGKNSGLKGF